LPSAIAVLWASAIGLIAAMGCIIAWLINKGFDTVKASIEHQFQVLWGKFDEFQKSYNATAASLQAHKEAEEVRERACAERHRKIDEEIEHLRERRGERRHEQEL